MILFKHILCETIEHNTELQNLILDYVISSLNDFEKRKSVVSKLITKEDELKPFSVLPNKFIYRYIDLTNNQFEQLKTVGSVRLSLPEYSSWSLTYNGAKKIMNWYKKDYKTNHPLIFVKSTTGVSCLVNIPKFFKDKTLGKYATAIVKSEQEVIVHTNLELEFLKYKDVVS